MVKLGIGLHPEEFITSSLQLHNNDDTHRGINNINFDSARKLLSRFEQTLLENINNIDAIGETGLDYYWLFKNDSNEKPSAERNMQEEIEMEKLSFIRHVELAKEHNLPLSIHSREIKGETQCIEDTLRIIIESGKGCVMGSMHSYTGNIEYIQDIIDLNFMVGFNQIITYKNASDVRELVKVTPLEMILLETDCPLLPLRKPYTAENTKYGYPVDVKVIAKVIAEIKGLSQDDVIYQTDKNFERVFCKKK
jgi:TatD DNase family protein